MAENKWPKISNFLVGRFTCCVSGALWRITQFCSWLLIYVPVHPEQLQRCRSRRLISIFVSALHGVIVAATNHSLYFVRVQSINELTNLTVKISADCDLPQKQLEGLCG